MTLTEAAFLTKRFGVIALGFLAVVTIIVLIIVIQDPPPPPEYVTPTCACTDTKDEFLENILTIPSLEIVSESAVEYDVQTITGMLNDLPKIVNVYRYTDLGQLLDSRAQAKILAKKMGFNPERIVTRGTTGYTWYDESTKRSLSVNARDLNFTLNTTIESIKSIRKEQDLPSKSEAKSIAINTLRSLGILNTQYSADTEPFYIDINPDGTYSQADSAMNAELIRVDFSRKIPLISIRSDVKDADRIVNSLIERGLTPITDSVVVGNERIEVYNFSQFVTYQNPNKSNISVYVGPENKSVEILKSVYQIDFKSWSIEPEKCGTYPLLDPSVAKDKIESGEGSIVFLNYGKDQVQEYVPQQVKRFVILSVTITYYEGLLEQKYLQPVYLFTGEAELKDGTKATFHIYYPAISYDSVTDKVEVEEATVEKDGGILSL